MFIRVIRGKEFWGLVPLPQPVKKSLAMPLTLTPQETDEIVHSLKRYFAAELDQELGELRAKLLLDYVLKEIAPLAYNQGVKDAEEFLRARLEDLPATVFEPGFTYWRKKPK